MAPPLPQTIMQRSGTFSPSNVGVFPASIVFNSGTLASTSYCDGFSGGYWSNVTYQDASGATTGNMHVFIGQGGTNAQMWGTLTSISGTASNSTNVSAQWDASTQMMQFSSLANTCADLASGSVTPNYGPPMVDRLRRASVLHR